MLPAVTGWAPAGKAGPAGTCGLLAFRFGFQPSGQFTPYAGMNCSNMGLKPFGLGNQSRACGANRQITSLAYSAVHRPCGPYLRQMGRVCHRNPELMVFAADHLFRQGLRGGLS